ncbi:MAG: hypothetical protein ACD_83C00239G0001 [uncultured bacterium]|uniref:Uncharacterized protein n=1 Tax=Berkelbacteria bacterium GW2011_GWA2_38_9 TaxID=1618334 RepID=A0A0G0PCK2_9BACT|nr:MAG: hypothetical protein ACD_83C00239G0001 [uncultured bacterium]KKQ87011.1 MAG: hypothetical protein UT11_C0058G0007 [Berkelbacteria bacterium GW2011_GWA2_38_9]
MQKIIPSKNYSGINIPSIFWIFVGVSTILIWAWVRMQKFKIINYWWVYPGHVFGQNLTLWLTFIAAIILLLTLFALSIKSRLAVVLGILVAIIIPIVFSHIIYTDSEWHTDFQRGPYEKVSYSYSKIFFEPHKNPTLVLLENYNKFQENQRIKTKNIDFSITKGSISTHPPGHIIAYGYLGELVQSWQNNGRSQFLEKYLRGNQKVQGSVAYLQFILSVIIIVLGTFLLAFNLTKSRALSLVSAASVPLAPTFILFGARPDILIAAFFIFCFGFVTLLESRKFFVRTLGLVWLAVFSIILLLLSFGMIIIIPAILVFLIFRISLGKISTLSAFVSYLIYLTIIIATFYFFKIVTHYDYLYNFYLSLGHQLAISQQWQVSFFDSLDFNIYETLPMFGLVASLGAVWSLVSKNNNKYWWFSLFCFIIFALVDFSGRSRGENGRIWVFLAPFFIISATTFLSQLGKNKFVAIILFILLLFQNLFFLKYFSVLNF